VSPINTTANNTNYSIRCFIWRDEINTNNN
jgi:hypothetical protein